MTLFYYIAADKELPTGSFGKNKTIMKLKDALKLHPPSENSLTSIVDLSHLYEQNTEVYETEQDAAGLFVSGPLTHQDTSSHFRHPFVYQVDHDGGSFQISGRIKEVSPQAFLLGKKCLTELFAYLDHNLGSGEYAELYACWAHGMERFEEPRNSKLDLVLNLNTFELEEEF